MEKFFLEEPSLKRKEEAFDYINEFIINNSIINGVGGLDRYFKLNDYEGWLTQLEDDFNVIPNEEVVPSKTYFLVRVNDNKIIGMINIRLCLNERIKYLGGNIGYSIRPSERRKGYNKINLYLGLLKCREYGLNKVLMDTLKSNIGSIKTIEALGGIQISEFYEKIFFKEFINKYLIDVNSSLEKNKVTFNDYVLEN